MFRRKYHETGKSELKMGSKEFGVVEIGFANLSGSQFT